MTDEFDQLINQCWRDNLKLNFNRFGYQPFIKNAILYYVSKYTDFQEEFFEVDDDTEIENLFFDAEDQTQFSKFYLNYRDSLIQIHENYFPLHLGKEEDGDFEKNPLPEYFFGIHFKKNDYLGQMPLKNIFKFPSVFPKIRKVDSLSFLLNENAYKNYFVSERFDGLSAVWTGKELLSKKGKLCFTTLPKDLIEELENYFANEIVLGTLVAVTSDELKVDEIKPFMTKKQVFSTIAIKDESVLSEKTKKNCKRIKFCVHDLASFKRRDKSFSVRYDSLKKKVKENCNEIILVKQKKICRNLAQKKKGEISISEIYEQLARGFLQSRKGAVFTLKDSNFYNLFDEEYAQKKIGVKAKLLAQKYTKIERLDEDVATWTLPIAQHKDNYHAKIKIKKDTVFHFKLREESRKVRDFPLADSIVGSDSVFADANKIFITAGDFKNDETDQEDTRFMGAHVVYTVPTKTEIENLTLANSISPKKVGEQIEKIFFEMFSSFPDVMDSNVNEKLFALGYQFNFTDHYYFSEETENDFEQKKLGQIESCADESLKKKKIFLNSRKFHDSKDFFVFTEENKVQKPCWFSWYHKNGSDFDPDDPSVFQTPDYSPDFDPPSDGGFDGQYEEIAENVCLLVSEYFFPFEFVYKAKKSKFEMFALVENEEYEKSLFESVDKTKMKSHLDFMTRDNKNLFYYFFKSDGFQNFSFDQKNNVKIISIFDSLTSGRKTLAQQDVLKKAKQDIDRFLRISDQVGLNDLFFDLRTKFSLKKLMKYFDDKKFQEFSEKMFGENVFDDYEDYSFFTRKHFIDSKKFSFSHANKNFAMNLFYNQIHPSQETVKTRSSVLPSFKDIEKDGLLTVLYAYLFFDYIQNYVGTENKEFNEFIESKTENYVIFTS